MSKSRCKRHQWVYKQLLSRHHKVTGAYLGQLVVERCMVCGKKREVDSATGREIKR